jgi:hypothetical protein
MDAPIRSIDARASYQNARRWREFAKSLTKAGRSVYWGRVNTLLKGVEGMRSTAYAFTWIVAAGATSAWAQYGLYGSPEMLPLSQMGSPAVSGAAAPAAQTLPAAAYLPAQGYPNTMAVAAPQPLITAGNPAYGAAPGQGYYVPNAGNPAYGAAPGQGYYVPTASAPSPVPVQLANPQRMMPVPQAPGPGVVDQMLREASPGN